MSSASNRPVLVPDATLDSLSSESVALSARRLGSAAVIAALAHVVYVVLYQTVWSASASALGMGLSLVGLSASLGTAVYLLSGPRPAPRIVAVAIAYEALLTLTFAVSESWASTYHAPSVQVSWSSVVIVLFPFLIPARPALVLASSVAAAAMTPVGMALVFGLSERPLPQLSVLASYALPPFVCALLAWAPTRALSQLAKAVQAARRLGNYELIRRLGAGGMGEVWLAKHRLLARPAAVKLIKPEGLGAKDAASRELMLRRFEREAQVTANLDSPHTVELYDFGVAADGTLFYVMELLRGVDLETLVQRFGPLPSERVVHLLLQACDSLHDAHVRGLIHRDIKPANLFVSRKGNSVDFLKVVDFGLVKRWTHEAEQAAQSVQQSALSLQQTAVGSIVGTPAFLAPEAVLGDQAVDQRTDIYALGCVAYWMLTGKYVFAETTVLAMLTAHVTKTPELPSQRSALAIDPELERIVMACLAKDRDQRPASAEALREALAKLAMVEPWSRERALSWWQDNLADDTAGDASVAA